MDKFNVSQKAEISKTISETDVYLFSGISGDFNLIHLNAEYAKKLSLRKGWCKGL